MSSKIIDYFINEVTETLFRENFHFICWEFSPGYIDVLVKDDDENRVSEHLDRRFIIAENGNSYLVHWLVEIIITRFREKKYDKPYELKSKYIDI